MWPAATTLYSTDGETSQTAVRQLTKECKGSTLRPEEPHLYHKPRGSYAHGLFALLRAGFSLCKEGMARLFHSLHGLLEGPHVLQPRFIQREGQPGILTSQMSPSSAPVFQTTSAAYSYQKATPWTLSGLLMPVFLVSASGLCYHSPVTSCLGIPLHPVALTTTVFPHPVQNITKPHFHHLLASSAWSQASENSPNSPLPLYPLVKHITDQLSRVQQWRKSETGSTKRIYPAGSGPKMERATWQGIWTALKS